MNRFLRLGVLVVGLVCSGEIIATRAGEASPKADPATMSLATNAFAFDLYRQLAAEKTGENLFFSPYSLELALAVAAHGARGETAEEMGRVLALPDALRSGDPESPWNTGPFLESLAAVSDEISTRTDLFELSVANALWVEQTYPFERRFLESIQAADGERALFSVDFRHDFESVRQEINRWTEAQTNQRIRDLLAPRTLTKATTLVISNAIYFKGEWSEKFDENKTKEGDFSLAGGEMIPTELMNARDLDHARYGSFHRDGSFFETPHTIQPGQESGVYPDSDGFLALELPYTGDRLGMLLLVPQDASGLAGLEPLLSADALAKWVGHLEERAVHVTLPKFSLDASYSMEPPLSRMGMVRAFDPGMINGADFSGMTDSQEALDALYLEAVVHRAFLEVNEEGTEAAAATAAWGGIKAIYDRVPFVPTVRADRPFVFLIRDTISGTILFLGRFAVPAA